MTATLKTLIAIANRHSGTGEDIATETGLGKAATMRALRTLSDRGFVFCEDDFDGRRREGGKYTNALWVMNCEISGITEEQAAEAMRREAATPGMFGGDILCDMGIAC